MFCLLFIQKIYESSPFGAREEAFMGEFTEIVYEERDL